jgi:hypothetical protein
MMPKMTAYPPPSYGDLGELEKIFASSFPEMITQMSGLLGKRTPRLKKKDVARQKAKLRKFLVTSRAYLLGLRALSGEPDRAKCVYALLEGLLREQLRAGGKGIPAGKDSFEFLLMATERAASSPNQAWAKLAAYSASKQSILDFSIYLHQRLNPRMIEEIMEEWYRSNDARKLIQFGIQWPSVVRQFCVASPKRLTIKLANQLASEYRTSSSFLEQRLRLLVFLDSKANGETKKWVDWQKCSLFELLKYAESNLKLGWIPPLIERHVRNALAHGQPEINVDSQQCKFHDSSVTIAWSISEFYEKSRSLTLAARALLEFESILRLVQVRVLVENLWLGVAATPPGSP